MSIAQGADHNSDAGETMSKLTLPEKKRARFIELYGKEVLHDVERQSCLESKEWGRTSSRREGSRYSRPCADT